MAKECGPDTRGVTVDTADEASVAALAAELGEEEVSILVNNADVAGPVAPLTEIAVGEWDEVFAVDVRGVFLMCRAVLPAMVDGGVRM